MEFYTYQQVQESARALREKLNGFQPRVLLILGSGLGALADEVESPVAVPYSEVPHMKHSTAPGHKGQFLFGKLAGKDVAVMRGGSTPTRAGPSPTRPIPSGWPGPWAPAPWW